MSAAPGAATVAADLDALRARLAEAPDAERLLPLGLGRVIAAPTPWRSCRRRSCTCSAGRGRRSRCLVDAPPMRRGGTGS